ncbi:MAG: DUF7452 domain-containing protein [Polyangiales bacterium]
MSFRKHFVAPAVLATLAGCSVSHQEDGTKQALEAASVSTGLKVRPVAKKGPIASIDKGYRTDTVILKLAEGTHIRYVSGKWTFDASTLTEEEQILFKRNGLDSATVIAELGKIDGVLATQPKMGVVSMIKRDDKSLASEKLEGELATGEELADLGLYYVLGLDQGQAGGVIPVINALNQLKIVEIAYAQAEGQGAAVDIPPSTMNFDARQTFLDAAPTGVDARFAWTVPGGNGAGIKIIDVEAGWLLEHEDFDPIFYRSGTFSPFDSERFHGTAVLGVLHGARNGYGVTGIAHGAQVGVDSPLLRGVFEWWDPAGAIDDAAHHVDPGDVVLIEQHYPGPSGGASCNTGCGNCGQFAYVAVENGQAEFDVIRAATARGVIVVEAAGNGQMDLDGAQFERRFDRTFRDSGALMVGGGNSSGHGAACWSNAGTRVDVQGWGDSVFTSGYGDEPGPRDDHQYYTAGFSGTSSGSAIVAGVVAAVQGARVGAGFPRLSPSDMRSLLQRTGTPQAPGRNIGPLPNMRAAIDGFRTTPTTLTYTATTATITGHRTVIDDPHANGNPNATLMVTPLYSNATTTGGYDDHPIGVWFNGSRWEIFNQDFAAMPANAMFEVSINRGFLHTSTSANTTGSTTRISSPDLDGHPEAIVNVTANWGTGGPYVPIAVVAKYDGSRWTIQTSDGRAMPANAKFNVLVNPPGVFDFRHVAATGNIINNQTDLTIPIGFHLPDSFISRVHMQMTPVATSTLVPQGNYGMWWAGSGRQWSIFEQARRAMTPGANFNVHLYWR